MASTGCDIDGEKKRLREDGDVKTTSGDVEQGIESQPSVDLQERAEPFGDESNNEVKYRTMAWWYVRRSRSYRHTADCRIQASWHE